jgi:RimJ/RimL family protein N-acetyltransferase
MIRKFFRVLKIARSQFSNHGFSGFFALVFRSLFKVERISVYAKKLDHAVAYSGNQDVDGYVKKGERAELEKSRKNMNTPCWEFSCDLYDGVKDFFIYKKNGLLGHISWIYYRNDPNRIIDLAADEGEVKYSLTLPEFRGKGIYPATLIEVQRYLKEQGYKRLFICTREDNLPSVKGIEKAGFEFVTKINLIKVLGMQVSKRYATGR